MLLKTPEYENLAWNNYSEDIGEGRTYQGHWIKPKEEIDEHDRLRKTGKPLKGDTPADAASKKRDFRGFGTIKFPDGSIYQGQTENGLFNGKGRMTHANGDIYQGQWVDGKAHGLGTFIDTKGSLYDGQWVDDLQEGKGSEIWDYNKIKYTGDFVEGKKTG